MLFNSAIMKKSLLLSFCIFIFSISNAQIALTGVTTTNVTSNVTTTYLNAGNTYNWSISPNNVQKRITGFTSAAGTYVYSNALNGIVKMRRVNNAGTTGDFTLVWSEGSITATPFNMQANMPATMEAYFDDNVYNKGTDNFFDNISANSNNIERMDWILSGGYSTTNITKVGFAVFERGADNAHDAFAIAAITGLDAMGNPNNYGTLKKVTTAQWGNITSSGVSYRILKAASGTNLLDAGVNTQNRGGVFLPLSSLGITSGTTIYGYSIFANDVPLASTVAQLVDVSATNTLTYPTNTASAEGGIDMIATTGIFVDITVLPIVIESFSVTQNSDNNELRWKYSDNNNELLKFEIEKSFDGTSFQNLKTITPVIGTFDFTSKDFANQNDCYYRLKVTRNNGSYFYSDILKVKQSKIYKTTIVPNPVMDNATINYFCKKDGVISFSIFDVSGKQIAVENIFIYKGLNAVKLSKINGLQTGQYFLTIVSDTGEKETLKFVKY